MRAESGMFFSPYSTNPYWREEIDLGPGPPVRKAQRDGRGKPEMKKTKKRRQLQAEGLGSRTDTGTSSGETVIGDGGGESGRGSQEGWNRRRYQRADEILWGLEPQSTNSSGRGSVSRSASGSTYQYHARNPAINDLHPPVVSTQPTSRSETQWMLQPPPKAKVMEGKERQKIANTPNRSRSTSGGSNWSRGTMKKSSDVNLGKQIGERLMESKFKQGVSPMATESALALNRVPPSRGDLPTISSTGRGQPHARDMEAPMMTGGSVNQKKTPPPPITISSDPPLPSPLPARPPLSTVPSESIMQRQKEWAPHLRPALITANSTSSLHVLQELVAPSSQLNSIRVAALPLPNEAVSVQLPPISNQEDAELKLPEVDSWFPENEWDFPPSRKENSTAPPGHRWSMSI